MNNNKNENSRNRVRTDKRFLVILVSCFALFIGAVLVTSVSTARVR
ncbi:MAG: hypothetical protein WAM42_04595 [Candidatus Nitrosopolaris sp.]